MCKGAEGFGAMGGDGDVWGAQGYDRGPEAGWGGRTRKVNGSSHLWLTENGGIGQRCSITG